MSVQSVDDLCNELTLTLGKCLAEGRTKDALSIIRNNMYVQCLKDKSWDIIPAVSKYLTQETVESAPEVYECCQTLLIEIAEVANPEEALLEILEEAENVENDVKFLALLKPLQNILLKLPKRRGQSLEWCLNTILAHIGSLPLPKNYKLEGEERKLLDSDPCAIRITEIYKGVMPFCKPFVESVSLRKGEIGVHKADRQRNILVSFILQLLNKPLAFLDLVYDNKSKSGIRVVCEELLSYLTLIVGDIMMFLEFAEMREIEVRARKKNTKLPVLDDETEEFSDMYFREDKTPILSIAVLNYLILAEKIQLDSAPCVYSPLYIFQTSLYLIVILMRHSHELLVYKGLCLAQAVIASVPVGSVPYYVLESPVHSEFVELLSKVMIYCEVEELRKSSVYLLHDYLFIFDTKGQYLLMSNLLPVVNHAGIIGYLVMQLKDMIINTLNSQSPSKYFTGKTLFDLIYKYCSLQHGAETDLVENVDQIVSSLNLIRFLALRDSDNNTGLWDYIGVLEKSLLVPLREGITLSRAHYQLKLKDIEEEKKVAAGIGKETVNKSNVTITIGGQQLPNLPHENKVSVIASALNAFDLMESLLIRVNECIESKSAKS
ncbi:glomulin-like isoform X1 [Periplaneta americana]|uniref:glomulin-like isoform X1 n=1 Tax=Periplaneta americana TaxID=6978 RepID=UPI0037E72C68